MRRSRLTHTGGVPSLPFIKAHGAGNDFLIVERSAVESLGVPVDRLRELAAGLCDRRFGIGADGLELTAAGEHGGASARAHLWNSDGSEAEISGNGTRCVAAWLALRQPEASTFRIETGAGARTLRLVRRRHPQYEFRMASDPDGCRVVEEAALLEAAGAARQVVIVEVGNPQCVCRVESFQFDWRRLGAALERHPRFRNGSNVSFVKVGAGPGPVSSIEVRFWERGAGATLSSGTGALGAAVAARHLGWVGDRVAVATQGGDLAVDWDDGIGLTGPARIVADGRYELDPSGLR